MSDNLDTCLFSHYSKTWLNYKLSWYIHVQYDALCYMDTVQLFGWQQPSHANYSSKAQLTNGCSWWDMHCFSCCSNSLYNWDLSFSIFSLKSGRISWWRDVLWKCRRKKCHNTWKGKRWQLREWKSLMRQGRTLHSIIAVCPKLWTSLKCILGTNNDAK